MTTLTHETADVVSASPVEESFRTRFAGRLAVLSATIIALVAGTVAPAFADGTDPVDAKGVFSSAAPGLTTALLGVAGVVVLPAVTILAVKKGWPMLKRMF